MSTGNQPSQAPQSPSKYNPGDRVVLFGKAMATVVSVGCISLVVKVDKNGSIVQCGYGSVKTPGPIKIIRKSSRKTSGNGGNFTR